MPAILPVEEVLQLFAMTRVLQQKEKDMFEALGEACKDLLHSMRLALFY